MAKIAVVAADYGESRCVGSVSAELNARGHECKELLGHGKPMLVDGGIIDRLLEGQGLLLVAISENDEMEVAIAKRANEKGIPVAIYAPGNGAYSKTSAAPLRDFASLLLLGNKADEEGAKGLFPQAEVFVVGNVLHEDGYPAVSREESRQMLGVAEDEKVIFVPSDKRLGINWPLFHSVIEACHRGQVLEHKPVIVFGLHPGDPNSITCYTEAATFSRKVLVLVKAKQDMPGTQIVPGCDLMVTACSTLAEVAAYQRKPVIGFFFESLLADIEGQRGDQPFVWNLEENGAAVVVRRGSIDDLSQKIDELLTSRESHLWRHLHMRKNQERHYPTPPEPGSTAKRAADVIEGKFFPR
ncbi:MAG: hypothetical protein AAB455_02265 [Patescibacteria group bacterium]